MADAVSYPIDYTGTAAANSIQNESNTLLVTNALKYLVVIPRAAPYFLDSMNVVHVSATGVRTTLRKDVDWAPCFYFRSASLSLDKKVYAGINILNNALKGSVEIDYQTLGGEWTIDVPRITQVLSDLLRNPRTVYWEQISGKPTVFPPTLHSNNYQDSTGHDETVQAINDVARALLNKYNGSNEWSLALSDADTELSVGNLANFLRTKGNIRLMGARAGLGIASTSGEVVLDILVGGSSILTNKIHIPQGSDTSKSASVQPTFSTRDFPDDTRFNFKLLSAGNNAVLLHVYLEFVPR